MTFSLNCCWLSNAVFLNAQFEQQGESIFPNKWTFILCVSMGEFFEKCHKNLNSFLSARRIWSWWNILVISVIIANCLSQNFDKTQMRLLRKSGPVSDIKNDSNFVRFHSSDSHSLGGKYGWGAGGKGELALFLFFQGLSFIHLETTLTFAKLCYAFEEKNFFCHHNFMKNIIWSYLKMNLKISNKLR